MVDEKDEGDVVMEVHRNEDLVRFRFSRAVDFFDMDAKTAELIIEGMQRCVIDINAGKIIVTDRIPRSH